MSGRAVDESCFKHLKFTATVFLKFYARVKELASVCHN